MERIDKMWNSAIRLIYNLGLKRTDHITNCRKMAAQLLWMNIICKISTISMMHKILIKNYSRKANCLLKKLIYRRTTSAK